MPISFRGAGTPYTATGLGTSFTLNKPDGVVAGDRMFAMVAGWLSSNSPRTITASGWTSLNTVVAQQSSTSDYLQVTLLTRYAGDSEPSSWTATASSSLALRVAGVTAYDGVQETGNRGTSKKDSGGSSFSTATVNVVDTGSWRLVAGAYFSGSASYNIASNEVSRRWIEDADSGSGAVQGAMWDSNGSVSTGNTSRTVSRSAVWTCAASVIVILEPETGTPATGDLHSTLPKLDADGGGRVENPATVSASLPSVEADMEGFGQPPEVTGDVSASLPAVSAALVGGQDVAGTLDASISLSMEAVGETRFFGVRVINVEHDDRVIEVESRAVAD